MTAEKIRRISELAKKSRTPEGLTEEEKAEQAGLRAEYVAAMKQSLRSQWDCSVVVRSADPRQPPTATGRYAAAPGDTVRCVQTEAENAEALAAKNAFLRKKRGKSPFQTLQRTL